MTTTVSEKVRSRQIQTYSTMLTALLEDIVKLELYLLVVMFNVFPSDNLSEERYDLKGLGSTDTASKAAGALRMPGRDLGIYIINNKVLISTIKD